MNQRKLFTRREFLEAASALPLASGCGIARPTSAGEEGAVVIENDSVRYVVSPDGRNRMFVDKRSGRDYCVQGSEYCLLSLKKNGRRHRPSRCSSSNGAITVEFNGAGVRAECSVAIRKRYFTLELKSVEGEGVEEITLSNLCLDISEHIGTIANVAWNGQFGAGVMALNLQTAAGAPSQANAPLAGTQAVLWAGCYPKTGLIGAKIGVVASPAAELRSAIKEMVLRDGFVHSEVGGAWALDAAENRYSYLFAYASEADVEDWIAMARSGGFREILISEIGPYGHYDPDPKKFPHGMAGVKTVVEKIHAAGMKAGWHMLAFTIQKNDPWVTPAPDPRLATGRTLTLAEPISAKATFVPTVESPAGLPTHSGFWFRGGMDILVSSEILAYSGLKMTPPYGLTGCRRGAYGTRAAAHDKGAALRNLKEVFGTYVPKAGSSLMEEMERRFASIVDTCGFDMIYFDGLDGADVFAGSAWEWYYGPRFALNVFKRVRRRLQVEASAWFHHDWHITSRLGAWDHPVRDPKSFVDLHVASNNGLNDLLPTQLGWWAFNTYQPRLSFAATPDVIEYLCSKCLGNDSALSLEEITPQTIRENPEWPRLLTVMGEYEPLRLGREIPEPVKAKLRAPGKDFTLTRRPDSHWQFAPVDYHEHKVMAVDGVNNVINMINRFAAQPPRFRIRALESAASYNRQESTVLANFKNLADFVTSDTQGGVRGWLEAPGKGREKQHEAVVFRAASRRSDRRGAWARMGKRFSPPLNMAGCPALGVWVRGDGMGEVLNFQRLDDRGARIAADDHYVVVDFTGWRYFELVEPEAKRWSDYVWPYTNSLALYRESVNNSRIAELNLYYNNLPPGGSVACSLSAVKGLAVADVKLERPRLTVAGKTLAFPVSLESGSYLEFNAITDCRLYDARGALVQAVKPEGGEVMLGAGENRIIFDCDGPRGYRSRALITTITSGSPLAS